MNSKTKKLFSIFILIVVVVSSFTYYEYATEPKGVQGICNGGHSVNYSMNKSFNINGISYLYSNNIIPWKQSRPYVVDLATIQHI